MATIIELNDANTCKICENALGKYSCPKCNTLYCSLPCYQSEKHLQCSENFYKESIMLDLNLDQNNEQDRSKINEILQRAHASNEILGEDDLSGLNSEENDDLDSDDDVLEDLTARLQGVDLDKADKVWEKLTEDEKQEFVAFLKTEDVSKLIPSWNPWWLSASVSKIEVVDSNKDDFKKECPKLSDIKDFSSICKKTPAASVKFNLINILASYLYVARYFNGEYLDFAKESTSAIIEICLCLKNGQNFEEYEMAVKSVEQEIINSDWIMGDQENFKVMHEDLEKILKGPNLSEPKFFILSALSDIKKLFLTSLKKPTNNVDEDFNKKFNTDVFPQAKVQKNEKVKNVSKKIDFYLSYAKDCFVHN